MSNKVIGSDKKLNILNTQNDASFAEDLNHFYSRFDVHDFSQTRSTFIQSLPKDDDIIINDVDVLSAFRRVNIRKSIGPDRIPGIVL